MNWPRILSGTALIVVVVLSVYFGAVAAAPKPSVVGPSLTIYQLDSRGQFVASASNVFEAGQLIGVGVTNGASPPYTLTVTSLSGLTVFSEGNSSFPAGGFMPVSLAPTQFPPGTPFTVALQDNVFYSPGFSSPQTSKSSFTVVPALASIQLKSSLFRNNTIQAQIGIQDYSNNPLTGVRLGLFLVQGNSSLLVTTEKTDLLGRSTFRVGTSLAGGTYRFQIGVIDSSAVFAASIQLPSVSVSYVPTALVAWTPVSGSVQSRLLRSNTQASLDGRLLVLEQRLADGNWTVTSQAYTDETGQALFRTNTTKTSRVSFNGDNFYASSRSLVSNATIPWVISLSTPGRISGVSLSQSSSLTSSTNFSISPSSGGCPVPCCVGPTQVPIVMAAMVLTSSGVSPNCGGGGGGTPVSTTTTLYLPSSAYATIPIALRARVVDQNGNPVVAQGVEFYNSTSSSGHLIGIGNTNSTGYASVVWTPGVTGAKPIFALYVGDSGHYGSSAQGSLPINQTPTTIQMLQPLQMAYSWDLYNYYSGNGLPIVVPVNILTLATSNNTSPANIYMPPYSGASSNPSHVLGYGWAGLNQSSAVTITMNSTYTQTQSMNWTRNFYLPPCLNPPNCSTTPRTGHMYLTASLAPPSTLYSSSSTTLNIPFQKVNSVSTSSSQVLQSATPPAHLYVNVNASYPYLSITMQGLPVSLAAYNAYLAYTLGAPTSSFLSSGYTFYALTGSTDFAYVCTDSTCNTPAANVAVYLYDYNSNRNLVYCGIYSTTNNRGIAYIVGNGGNCGYPYAYAAIYTSGNTLALSEIFRIEAVSNPSPFLTNFQGYNYAVYAPQKTGRYLLDMRTFFLNSAYTVLYPTASYPDVQYPYNSCCDIFLTVQKHPLQTQASFKPATPTILNNTNATIQLEDLATSKPLSNSNFNYTLTRNTPNPGTIRNGVLTTNANGTSTLSLGLLSYGNYMLTISRSATATLNALSSNFNITIYRALPTLILRDVSALQTANPNVVKFIDPSGTSTLPSIVLSESSPYQFYAIVGTSTSLLSTPPGVSPTCTNGSQSVNCVVITMSYGTSSSCAQNGCLNGHQGTVFYATWANGQLGYGPYATICPQVGFTNCSATVTSLTGTSNICGTLFCYEFSVFVGGINNLGGAPWLYMGATVYDSSSSASYAAGFGYVTTTYGFFIVNGARMRPSDASTPLGRNVSFQLNETNSPNSLSSVTMTIANSTTTGTKSICLIGGSGCLQPAQTTSGNFILYAANSIVFSPGAYIVTVYVTCPNCGQTTIQVFSLVLVVSQSSWNENAVALNPYTYETSLISNATTTQLAVSGLTENIYINGVLYKTLQTDSNGNGLFTWTPQVAGQYAIKSVLPGQNYYTNSTTTIIVSVARRNVLLAANNSPQSPSVNQPVTWNVYAQDMVSNSSIASIPISLFINGVNTTTVSTGSTGYAAFNPPAFSSKGYYNITFISATTSVYNSATVYDPLMVYLDTKLTLQAGTIILGQQDIFTVSLKDANGSTLSARVVQVKIDSTFYQNVTTDTSGQAQFSWRPDNTGIHSVSVSFSGTGSSDFAYRPSSAGLSVNVVTQTTTNTVSTSITQSVNLGTAQGSTQPSIPPPSISITFPNPSTISLSIGYNGKNAQASATLSNKFGLKCNWWGCLPYWNVEIDASVSGVLNYQLVGAGLGSITSATASIIAPPNLDLDLVGRGLDASIGVALAGDVSIAAAPLVPELAGAVVLAATVTATLAGAFLVQNGNTAPYKSYLYGLMVAPLVGPYCILAGCPEIPSVPGFEVGLAIGAWIAYLALGIVTTWAIGGWFAAIEVAVGFLLPALMLSLL